MAVMQRLRCSAGCGALEFDAMVERRSVGKGKRRSEKLLIIDRTSDGDGFPQNRDVEAICSQCGAALEIRMMAFAIGGRVREVVGEPQTRQLSVELGRVAAHVGERHRFHDCGSGGDGGFFEATVQGPLVAPQVGPDGPKLVEVGGVAVNDDGSAFKFGPGCSHRDGGASASGKPN